jgi:hypothetical protein
MANLRRGLVDKVKKAAAKVSTRGVQVATKAGTRGARVLVETTAAAVKTVDKLQQKLGGRSRKGSPSEQSTTGAQAAEPVAQQPAPRASRPMTAKPAGATVKSTGATAKTQDTSVKARRAAQPVSEAQPVAVREAGRKTMPAAAPKRSKQAAPAGSQFKVKRGQKHRHTGR